MLSGTEAGRGSAEDAGNVARDPAAATSAMEVLPITRAAGGARLASAAGSPIWPYANSSTRAALARMAELYDAVIVEEEPKPVPDIEDQVATRSGVVVSACAESDEAAALYAHLTRRRMMTAAQFGCDGERPRLDLLVAPWRMLTADLLGGLYQDPEWAPGLIVGNSPGELLRQALLRSAALALCGRNQRHRIDVRPFADHGLIRAGTTDILGHWADPNDLRNALESRSELMTIFTVGDGIDAGLGQLILCPMIRSSVPGSGRGPLCVTSGTCHRLQLPIAEAVVSDRLVSPDMVASRVLVVHACWGIQPAGSLQDYRWGYGFRLARQERIGAMMTPWQITMGAPADAEPLARDIGVGMPLGQALARFNDAASSRKTGQRMCLLGDPELRASLPAAPRRVARRARPASHEGQRQLAFLSAYLDTIVPKKESRRPLALAQAAVAAAQREAWSGAPFDSADGSGAAVRRAALRFLCVHGTTPVFHWIDLAHPVGADESSGPCLACGQATSRVMLRLRVLGAGARQLQLCPRCGITADGPAGSGRLGLTLADGAARRHGPGPVGPWTAAALLRPHSGKTVFWPWPAGEDGAPAREMPVAACFEPNAVGQLLLFMVDGVSLKVARAQYGYSAPPSMRTKANIAVAALADLLRRDRGDEPPDDAALRGALSES